MYSIDVLTFWASEIYLKRTGCLTGYLRYCFGVEMATLRGSVASQIRNLTNDLQD